MASGGINAAGWTGRIDAGEASDGQKLENAKLEQRGDSLKVTTGPAVAYWNPANTATGNYTVSATFTEPQYQNVNDHPHPYGLFIGGKNLESETPNFVYCVAYGNGNYLIRGFADGKVFQVGRGPSDAVNKTGADGGVTQEIAWIVKGDRVECQVNGKPVGSFAKSEITGPGKLESTDGIYGIRVSHNLDVMVTGLAKK